MNYDSGTIKLPKWVVPTIITLGIGLGSLIFAYGAQSRQITINTAAIQNKVNYKPEFEMVMETIRQQAAVNTATLNRIENKLDNHISSK